MVIALIGTGIWIYYSSRLREDITLAITIIGGIFSYFFVIQKQTIEDIRLFKELFHEFNQRYDCMNEKLNCIRSKDIDNPLSMNDKAILYNYFNLCGEESLYYQQGYILKDVWKAWCNGMLYFLGDERINALWIEEEKTSSYYGLTREKIESGSKK